VYIGKNPLTISETTARKKVIGAKKGKSKEEECSGYQEKLGKYLISQRKTLPQSGMQHRENHRRKNKRLRGKTFGHHTHTV